MKICLLAAGTGSRNECARHTVKGLLPVENRPIISHLLEQCPEDLEIVVAVGHRGHLLRDFFSVAYPKRKVTFVEVTPFEGPGSGPGLSLLACAPHLQCSFLLLPTDAFLEEKIPADGINWIGLGGAEEGTAYCLAETEGSLVKELLDKPRNPPIRLLDSVFTGIAFVSDFSDFFEGLRIARAGAGGEIQVVDGFRNLKKLGFRRMPTWRDTGTAKLYRDLIERAPRQQLLKEEEITYIYSDRVVKFHRSGEFIRKKARRASDLGDKVPPVNKIGTNFFSYPYVPGHLLSEEPNVDRFLHLLDRARQSILKPIVLAEEELEKFYLQCGRFYRDKSVERLELLFKKLSFVDGAHRINDVECPTIEKLLRRVGWSDLSRGVPSVFHGDFQAENLVLQEGGEVYLDWRHEFIDGATIGDLYYDLAKLRHSLLISGEVVRAERYSCRVSGGRVRLEWEQKENLRKFDQAFTCFLEKCGYSQAKVDVLAALIYLNIAPLYDAKYSEFLLYLGKLQLTQALARHGY